MQVRRGDLKIVSRWGGIFASLACGEGQQPGQANGCFVGHSTCEFSWLLRVTDHEVALLDPELFLSPVPRPVPLLVVETEVRTAAPDKQPVALLSSRENLIG
jgi:hypothetical protein